MNVPSELFSAISWRVQVTFHEMMMLSVFHETNTLIDFHSASSLKLQSMDRYVTPL